MCLVGGARFAVGPHTFEFLAPTGAGPILPMW